MPPFAPPLAGPVLDVLIAVFDLRHFDRGGALKDTTVRRYLRGDRVDDDQRWRALRAVAAAALASPLLSTGIAGVALDARTASVLGEVPPRDLLASFLVVHATRWNEIAGPLRGLAHAAARPDDVTYAYLRLAVLDVALRVGALLWLSDGPRGELPPPVWAEPRGASSHLRSILIRCGDAKPSHEELAAKVGVDPHTIDGWLGRGVRPGEANLVKLAAALGSLGAGEAHDLEREIRLVFSLAALAEVIAKAVGKERTLALARHFVDYANFVPYGLSHSKKPREVNDEAMRLTLLAGTFPAPPPWVRMLLDQLARTEDDPVWRTDIGAVTGSWFARLQDVTSRLGAVESALQSGVIVGEDPDGERLRHVVQARSDEWVGSGLREVFEGQTERTPKERAQWLGCLANEARCGGEVERARGLARDALALDPNEAELHYLLGLCHDELGAEDEAALEHAIAAQLRPEWDLPRVQHAIGLMNADRDREALEVLEAARRDVAHPSTLLLFMLAAAREFVGDAAGAVAGYEELLAASPDDPEALDRVAHLHFRLNDMGRGIDRCKRAHHLGVSTVFTAWTAGYYAKRKRRPHLARPTWAAGAVPAERLRIVEDPRRGNGS